MANKQSKSELGFRSSLRSRLALWIAAGGCAFALLVAVVSLGLGYYYLEQDFENKVRSHMELASISLQRPVQDIDYLELSEQIQAIMDYQDITGVRITDHNQKVLLERGEFSQQILSREIVSSEETLGWVEVSFSRQGLVSSMWIIFYAGAGLLILFLPGFVYLVWRVSGVYLLDLSSLTECIKHGSCREGLEEYPGLQRQDEVGFLAQALQDRDQDLFTYQGELEAYKNHLEEMVQERTLELKRSQMLSQSILNSVPDAIALIDIKEMTILDVNKVLLGRYNISQDEALGNPCYQVLRGYTQPCFELLEDCPVQDCFQQGRPCILEKQYSQGQGTIHLEVSAWPVLDEQGQVHRMVYIERDITERKRVEQLREDVQRIVRHDLKTPLNGIIGMAELLSQDASLGDEQQEFAGYIQDSGWRMLHMINHSLDLYRMEEGTYQPSPQELDLRDVLQELEKETQRIRKSKRLGLEYYLQGKPYTLQEPVLLWGEKQNIQSMLANLLTNALEAAPEDSAVSLDIQRYSGQIKIILHNLGVVPEEVRQRFFERYATAGKSKGTGLGTYSARLIARSHGGDIDFSSSQDEGTKVWVTLPDQPGS
ncbi:MAG: histidine kinase dimerization/phospho-acceptor domain-containing protein [Thermodesulfobacteriota bacterium]